MKRVSRSECQQASASRLECSLRNGERRDIYLHERGPPGYQGGVHLGVEPGQDYALLELKTSSRSVEKVNSRLCSSALIIMIHGAAPLLEPQPKPRDPGRLV